MQFKPGNIINEYVQDARDGFKDSWVSSYLIIEERKSGDYLKCLCIFDFDHRPQHMPGLIVDVSTDISKNNNQENVYWREVEP